MDAKEILSKIPIEGIVELLTDYYQIEMAQDSGNEEFYRFKTMCHNDNPEDASYKLYLYKDSKSFQCYSCCGQMDLYALIMQMNCISFQESIEFVKSYFNISDITKGFGRKPKPKYEVKPYIKKPIDFNERLPSYDGYILNTFLPYHAVEWLYEGISDETMDKYEIKFDIESSGIIIPHRDIDSNLVGIRQRNLDKRQIAQGRKYVPYCNIRTKIMYKHKLGMNLYGLNMTKDAIKKYEKCILWESEKSVLKMDSIYHNDSPSVAVGGSSINDYQLNLLKNLECKDIYVAFDNERFDDEKWNKKMKRVYNKIINFGFRCHLVKDWNQNLLENKDSPIDKGREIFEELLSNSREYKGDIDE